MTTTKTPAQATLFAISRKFFGGKNHNNDFWYDAESKSTDEGVLKGTVYKIEGKGKSKEIGDFEIESNGYISAFPSVPESFIKELNSNVKVPDAVSNKETPPVVAEDAITDEPEQAPKKRRGRPAGWKKKK